MERDLKKIISDIGGESRDVFRRGFLAFEESGETWYSGGYGIRWASRIKKAARRGRSSWDWREYCGGLFSGSLCHGFQL